MTGDPPCWLNEFNDFSMTTALASELSDYLAANDQRMHDELFAVLRIPSVSARSEHRGDMTRAAELLAASMRTVGPKAQILHPHRHPAGLGRSRGAPAGAQTLTMY